MKCVNWGWKCNEMTKLRAASLDAIHKEYSKWTYPFAHEWEETFLPVAHKAYNAYLN